MADHPHLGDLPRTGTRFCAPSCQVAEGRRSGRTLSDRTGCRTANSHGGLAMGAFAPRAAALSWKNAPVLDQQGALPKCDGKTTAASRNNKRHTLGLIPLVNGFCRLARGPKSCFFADSLTSLASLFRNRYRYGRRLSACPRGRLDSGGGSCILEAKGDGVRRITASGLMTPE